MARSSPRSRATRRRGSRRWSSSTRPRGAGVTATTPPRLDARRTLWRTLCSDHRCPALFVDLAAPDFAAAERALDAALGEPAR